MNKITQPQDGDVQLSELGHQCCEGNVEEILETLKSAGQPYVMLISPAKRTRQTANYFKANASVTFSLPELLEVDFGDFSGKPEDHSINGFTMSDYRNELINGRTNFRFPNGESIEEVSNRVKMLLSRLNVIKTQGDLKIETEENGNDIVSLNLSGGKSKTTFRCATVDSVKGVPKSASDVMTWEIEIPQLAGTGCRTLLL
jgi:hypothetical protein